jgi:hypothetical protein
VYSHFDWQSAVNFVPCPLSGGLGDSRFRVLSPSLPELEELFERSKLYKLFNLNATKSLASGLRWFRMDSLLAVVVQQRQTDTTMPDADPNDNGRIDNAPNNRALNDGKQWAQDLVLEEIGRNNPRLGARRKWILAVVALVVIAGGVSVGVVLSQSGDNQITARPTSPPTAALFVPSVIVNQFLSGLPPYSINLAESDANSPQAKALAWLENDPQYHDYRRVYRLNQRYALAVFYYSMNGDSWENRTGWLSDDNECTWYMEDDGDDHCGADSRLTLLDLFDNDLEGSIPTEVELLTDLTERFVLGDYDASTSRISGTIPTEM